MRTLARILTGFGLSLLPAIAAVASDAVPPAELRRGLTGHIENRSAEEYRPIPVEQLDRYVGQRVRVHVTGEGVREGTLLDAQNGKASIEQQRGSGVFTASFKTRRIEKAELPLDPSTPIRGNGAMSVMNYTPRASASGGGVSSQVTVIGSRGGRDAAAPVQTCPKAR